MFRGFPKIEGWNKVAAGFLGCNLGVFMLWHTFGSSSIRNEKLMTTLFMQTDRSLADGHFWSLFLPSFSHVGLSHITGNMLLFLYLGRKIHELLGPAKFVGLYLCGAAAGTIATEISYRFGAAGVGGTSNSYTRYVHILNGERPESMKSLGASDAVMGMVGFFYLCFPRSSVHLFPKLGLMDRWLERYEKKLGRLAYGARRLIFIRGGRLRAPAIYVLPMYFFFDFLATFEQMFGSSDNVDNVNHAAHIGGLFAGSAFYFTFGRALKAQYAPHLLIENDPRRWYLFGITIVAASVVWWLKRGISERQNKDRKQMYRVVGEAKLKPSAYVFFFMCFR